MFRPSYYDTHLPWEKPFVPGGCGVHVNHVAEAEQPRRNVELPRLDLDPRRLNLECVPAFHLPQQKVQGSCSARLPALPPRAAAPMDQPQARSARLQSVAATVELSPSSLVSRWMQERRRLMDDVLVPILPPKRKRQRRVSVKQQ